MSALLLLLWFGCGGECPGGDMASSEAGLTVTEAEHPDGWGRAECHAYAPLHRVSCAEAVDLAAVRAQVESEGTASCAACHGDNGVTP